MPVQGGGNGCTICNANSFILLAFLLISSIPALCESHKRYMIIFIKASSIAKIRLLKSQTRNRNGVYLDSMTFKFQ